jgi:hypothetical protein
MSNTQEKEIFDEHDHDSSDGEEKKAYESILSNPSYFTATMKVKKCVFILANIHLLYIVTFSVCF